MMNCYCCERPSLNCFDSEIHFIEILSINYSTVSKVELKYNIVLTIEFYSGVEYLGKYFLKSHKKEARKTK